MAAFYNCSECEREFLGPDDIPIWEGDHILPVCETCQPLFFECGLCGDAFIPPLVLDAGLMLNLSSTNYCQSCYEKEVEH